MTKAQLEAELARAEDEVKSLRGLMEARGNAITRYKQRIADLEKAVVMLALQLKDTEELD